MAAATGPALPRRQHRRSSRHRAALLLRVGHVEEEEEQAEVAVDAQVEHAAAAAEPVALPPWVNVLDSSDLHLGIGNGNMGGPPREPTPSAVLPLPSAAAPTIIFLARASPPTKLRPRHQKLPILCPVFPSTTRPSAFAWCWGRDGEGGLREEGGVGGAGGSDADPDRAADPHEDGGGGAGVPGERQGLLQPFQGDARAEVLDLRICLKNYFSQKCSSVMSLASPPLLFSVLPFGDARARVFSCLASSSGS